MKIGHHIILYAIYMYMTMLYVIILKKEYIEISPKECP